MDTILPRSHSKSPGPVNKARILVGLPGMPISDAMSQCLDNNGLGQTAPFRPSGHDMDVFSMQASLMRLPASTWAINVPHLPLDGISGVAGPGHTGDMFSPPEIEDDLRKLCGVYDKWRPYPATRPLSRYSVSMARRFTNKRLKMLGKIARDEAWELLYYVEHSPASLANLSIREANLIATRVIVRTCETLACMPYASLVIFSPYGVGKRHGFVASNRCDVNKLNCWKRIREYATG